MLGRQLRSEIGSGSRDRLDLTCSIEAVLTKSTIGDGDIARPVLGVYQHDAARAERDVIEVRLRPPGPMEVVQGGPAVPSNAAERRRDQAFALSPNRPGTLVLLCTRQGGLHARVQLRRTILFSAQLRDPTSTPARLLFRAEPCLAHAAESAVGHQLLSFWTWSPRTRRPSGESGPASRKPFVRLRRCEGVALERRAVVLEARIVTESAIEREFAVRLAAQAWLDGERARGREGWTHAELADFHFGGSRVPLMDRQRGIRKPADMVAALSMRTVFRPPGAARPYEDGTGVDGLLRYKWRGADPQHAENRALREAMIRELPLIWFYGFAEGLYSAVYPVYLIGEERSDQQFVVALGEDQRLVDFGRRSPEVLRRYVERTTWHRLHQPAFRAGVMRAYGTRCAVCAIRHSQLLDAAHITADADERGEPLTSNGLALCKIHHGAFDAGIIGIRPNLTLHVRDDVLDEIDGPMLRHGIQAHHDKPLMVIPSRGRDRPDEDRLEQRYAAFLAK